MIKLLTIKYYCGVLHFTHTKINAWAVPLNTTQRPYSSGLIQDDVINSALYLSSMKKADEGLNLVNQKVSKNGFTV